MQHSGYALHPLVIRRVGRTTVLAATAAAAAVVTVPAAPAHAQGFFQKLAGATVEMAMRNAPTVDVESRGLPTLAVGGLQLGVAKVAVKDTTAVRLQAYLFNPGARPVTVPAPDRGLFVLVDEKGRRLNLVLGPRIERHAGGPLTVPAMERVGFVLLFGGGPGAGVQTVTLKVGAVGAIPGIPLRGEAGGGATAAGGDNVWTRPGGEPAGRRGKVAKQVPAEPAEPAGEAEEPAPPSPSPKKNAPAGEPAEPEEPAEQEEEAPAEPPAPKPPSRR